MSYFISALALVFLAYLLSNFNPLPTREIDEGLFAVRTGFVNFYALCTNSGVVLFDTGTNAVQVRRGLQQLGIAAEEVNHILLTHSDYDHAGGITACPQRRVYLAAAEEQMVNGKTARRGWVHNSKLAAYQRLQDGETIQVGERRMQLHLTPGHTTGSAIYQVDTTLLITGDTLRLTRNGEILPFLWLMNRDHRQAIASLEAKKELLASADLILTGHTGLKRRARREVLTDAHELRSPMV
ncbi:MAG: MBL fold metallo-hydrolase [Symbiobacteriaceae bacterium]|nr:MBL fold metallo-hydrolase [Symbiobacteriaceae bacterium]